MFGNALPIRPTPPHQQGQTITIKEVIPATMREQCSCSYCGKPKLAAYHLITEDARRGVVCYPCSDQGMNWLEQNFPS